MSVDEVERIQQLTDVANDYLRGIGEDEDIHTLFSSPTFTDVTASRLVDDIRNKWQVDVDLRADAVGCVLLVDLLLFDIAVGNLTDNARKFGRNRNAVRIKVGAEGGSVIFDVTDDGPGIPVNEAQKVFCQFYKIDGNQTNAVEGCGLGLYVTKRIAKAHGGSAKVLSQSPSTLRLAFPLNTLSGATDA